MVTQVTGGITVLELQAHTRIHAFITPVPSLCFEFVTASHISHYSIRLGLPCHNVEMPLSL